MTHSPSQILRAMLVARGIFTMPSTQNGFPVYVSFWPAQNVESRDAASIFDDRGDRQGRLMRSETPGAMGDVIERPGVQILVRAQQFERGWKTISDVADMLDDTYFTTVEIAATANQAAGFYVIQNVSRDMPPMSLGLEPDTTVRRELFSLNALLTIKQV